MTAKRNFFTRIKNATKSLFVTGRADFLSWLRSYLPVIKFELSHGVSYRKDYARLWPKRILRHIDIVISEACSLNCKYCSNLMPHIAHPQIFDVTKIIDDIDKFFCCVKYVRDAAVLGGEPLLHPELPKILRHIFKYRKQYARLEVVTNGTIVPGEQLLRALSQTGIQLQISNYGPLSNKIPEIVAVCRKFKVLVAANDVQERWIEINKPLAVAKSESEAQAKFEHCRTHDICRSLKNGTLAFCPFLGNAVAAGIITPEQDDKVRLDEGCEAFWNYLCHAEAPYACRFCGGDGHAVSPLEQGL